MGFLKFLRRKPQAPTAPRLVKAIDRPRQIVSFSIDWQDSQPGDESSIPLPLAVALAMLEGHEAEGVAIAKSDFEFEIPFDQLPYLPFSSREILDLVPASNWSISIYVRNSIGRGDLKLRTSFISPQGEPVAHSGRRYEMVDCGLWRPRSERLIILPAPLLELWKLTKEGPSKLNDDKIAAEYRFLAKLKKAVHETQELLGEESVELDGQLLEEDFFAVDKVRVEVEPDEDGDLLLYPVLPDLDTPQLREELLGPDTTKNLFSTRDGAKRRRIALSPQCRREVSRIRKNHRIPAQKVGEFIDNPRQYLQPPEEFIREREILAEELGVDLFELEESPEFDPDQALDLSSIEEMAADFDLSEYGDRVIGIDTSPQEEPKLENIRNIKLGDWAAGPVSPSHSDSSTLAIDDKASPEHQKAEELREDFERSDQGDLVLAEAPLEALLKAQAQWEEDIHSPQGRARLITADNDESLQFQSHLGQSLVAAYEALGGKPAGFHPEYDLKSPFQPEGYVWLRHLADSEQDSGGLLADDMGMGKTIQVIALLCHLASAQKLRPVLLVVPKSTIPNWGNEIRKFCSIPLNIYEHLGPQRLRDPRQIEAQDIVLTTYQTLMLDQLMMGKIRFSLMICDEAQLIKNYSTARATACRAMNAATRIALTATPVENTLNELWSIMDFCQPGQLQTLNSFRSRFVNPIEKGSDAERERASRLLINEMAGHYLRRTKEQHLADELPQKHVHHIPVPMTDIQRAQYESILHQYQQAELQEPLATIPALLSVCTHPDALPPTSLERFGLSRRSLRQLLEEPDQITARSGKFQFILEKLNEIQAKGERAILFSSLRSVQEMLNGMIRHHFGFTAPLINGDTQAAQRQLTIDRFNQSPGFNIIILSTQAAGVGITVTGANHVFHVTREWNPALENQATDRAYRIGQTRDVHVYIPISEHPELETLDLHLHQMLSEKQAIADVSIIPRSIRKVSTNELARALAE